MDDKPNLWHYRDARAYLHDVCTWKQANERGFSFRKLVKLAELGAPGYVQSFIKGDRNIKSSTARSIAKAVGLGSDEQTFFELLVQHTQAPREEQRAAALEQMLKISARHGAGTIDAARIAYFTEWYIPVIHTLANLSAFRPDPEAIAKLIVPRIKPQQAAEALNVLQKLGLLEIDNSGEVHVAEPVLETGDTLSSYWLGEYQRQHLRLSERAIDLQPADERALTAFSVTIPEDKVEEALALSETVMRDFFYRILALQETGTPTDGVAYQCNLQMFRLSRPAKADRE